MIYLIGAKRKFNILNLSSYLPALIRKIANIPYNHVIIYDSVSDLAVEAVSQGVVIHNIVEALKPQDEVALYEYKELRNKELQTAHIISSIGHKYDFKELLQYQLIYNITGKQLQGSKDKNDKFICYSLAAFIFLEDDYYKVKPKEFLKRFKLIGAGNPKLNSDQLHKIKRK